MHITAFGGENFVSEKQMYVELVAPGVGKVACLECDGDPHYPSLFPPGAGVNQCIDCKGRGWVYISA